MRNIIKLFIAAILLPLLSCEHYESAYPDFSEIEPAYVELQNNFEVTVPEGGMINFVLTSRTVVYDSYTVNYEISGDYEKSGTIEVPAGVNKMNVSVPVDAGIVGDEALSASLSLTAVSNDMLLGRKPENLILPINITKFIPFVAADYATTFSCNEPGYGDYNVTFETTAEDNVLRNTNFWDGGLNLDYTFSADFDQLVSIESQEIMYGDTPLTVTGSGKYDGVTKTIVVDYLIVDGDGNVWDDNTHTFTLPS